MNINNIRTVLKDKRLSKGLSAEKLGKQVGVNKTTIYRYEKGEIDKMPLQVVNKLSEVLEINPLFLSGLSEEPRILKESDNIQTIYNKLNLPRQQKVYSFAEHQLEEQNSKIVDFTQKTYKEEIQAYLSAGTGVMNYYESDRDVVDVPEDAPEHDWIFKIIGDSMKPLFDTGDIVYVNEFDSSTESVQNGRIYVVEVDGEAYIKKVYVYEETKMLRLVSLNQDYVDLLFNFQDSYVKFIGRVII